MINLTLRDCKIFQSMHNVADTYRTPIMNYQMEILSGPSFNSNKREIIDHTIQYLARRIGNWSVFAPSVFAPSVMILEYGRRLEPGIYDIISDLLTLEGMRNCKSSLCPPKIFCTQVLTLIMP
jgi:hypothetical protein